METGRQLGVLINRTGTVDIILVGDRQSILIPDLSRYRISPGRLKGLRFIHTHLDDSGLSMEDLTDLLLLRLDMIVGVCVSSDGHPGKTHLGTLSPQSDTRWEIQTFPDPGGLPHNPLTIIHEVEQEMSRHISGLVTEGVLRAVLVDLKTSSTSDTEESMNELAELARTAGIQVTDTMIQQRTKPDPRYLVGLGKLQEIVIMALDNGAEMLVFNRELSPSQLRAIADTTELKVIDRTMLILDIFAQHAKSRGGKVQVELAQLRYLLPRLVGKGTALSRLAGGIGTRGPGETKLEVDRRRIRQRIATLKKSLDRMKNERKTRRKRRRQKELPVVSIVGYTNVGKSTLLNTLTRSDEIARNMLFATLDPVSRRLTMSDGTACILTDTVGLIQDLPPELMRAFSATFEEINDADLILHLADCSHTNLENQLAAVDDIMSSLGLDEIPRLLVLNKGDLVDPETLSNIERRFGTFSIIATDPGSMGPLLTALRKRLEFAAKGVRAF